MPTGSGDVISGVSVGRVNLAVRAKLCDSGLNIGRHIHLFDRLTHLRTFVQYVIAFRSRPEKPSDVISGTFVEPVIRDTYVAFCDLRSNRSR